jgi:hypothetical protein
MRLAFNHFAKDSVLPIQPRTGHSGDEELGPIRYKSEETIIVTKESITQKNRKGEKPS